MNTTPHAAAVRAAKRYFHPRSNSKVRTFGGVVTAEYASLIKAAEVVLSEDSHHCFDHHESEDDPCDMCCALNNLRAELARVKGES